MKLEEIHKEWEVDCFIDVLNLNNESSKTGRLHSKYWRILNQERLRLRHIEKQYDKLYSDKFWFYMNGEDEESRALGWKLPPRGSSFIKKEAKQFTDIDKDVVELSLKISICNEKIALLEDIIKNIHQRSYIISNIIQEKKFNNGD